MTNQRRVALIIVVLLATSLVTPILSGAVVADHTGAETPAPTSTPAPTPTPSENETVATATPTPEDDDSASTLPIQGAELSIRQPSYADGSVNRDGSSDKPLYRVEGAEQLIRSRNFHPSDVRYFGVDTEEGSLEYDPEMGLYVFNPQGHTGSFDVYWETDEVRYEATIRVTDGSDIRVINAEAFEDTQEDAEKWRDWNGTLDNLYSEMPLAWKVFGAPDREQLLQGMVNTYLASRDPGRWLTGSFMGAVIIVFLSLGGLALYILTQAGPGWVIYKLKRRLHWHESTEAFEGELADRKLQLEQREREQRLGNVDWNAIPGFNDHIAAAFREHLGTDALEGYNRLRAATSIDSVIKDRLRAMGQNGYAARRASADGGARESSYTLVNLEDVLGPDETMDDHDDLVGLDDPSDQLVEDVRDEDLLWKDFDFLEADLQFSEFDEPFESCDLETIIEELDPPMHYFDHELDYGKHLLQFARFVEEHPYTTDDGSVDSFRALIELLIRNERWLGDVHGVPGASARADSLERAVLDYDLGDRANEYVEDLREAKIE